MKGLEDAGMEPSPLSELDQAIADIEAMGDAPDMFEWANVAREVWPDMVRVVRAAQAFIRDWDCLAVGNEDVAGHVRAMRLALAQPSTAATAARKEEAK